MSVIFQNVVAYIVELAKLYLLTVEIFGIRQKKTVYRSMLISVVGVQIVSAFFDISKYSILYGVLSVVILSLHTCERRKTGLILLSYIGIGILDMVVAIAFIVEFDLRKETMDANGFIDIAINACSLGLLILLVLVLHKKRGHAHFAIRKYMAVYVVGGLAISMYLSSVQYIKMGENRASYGDNLIICLGLGSMALFAMCVLLAINTKRNESLVKETQIMEKLLKSQKEYYLLLLEKEKETRAFRHDIKQHLLCIAHCYDQGEHEKAREYLDSLQGEVKELSLGVQTGNDLVTAIATDISGKYPNVRLQWTGKIPDPIRLSLLDTCTIFYNLLANAFEAQSDALDGSVDVCVKYARTALLIIVANPSPHEPQKNGDEFVSTKSASGHGYGIQNIQACVERNGGQYRAQWEDGVFTSEIILPNVIL